MQWASFPLCFLPKAESQRRQIFWGRGRKGTGTWGSPHDSKKRVGQNLLAFISKSYLKRNLLRIQNLVGFQRQAPTQDWQRLELGVELRTQGTGLGLGCSSSFLHPLSLGGVHAGSGCAWCMQRGGIKGKEINQVCPSHRLIPKLSARV